MSDRIFGGIGLLLSIFYLWAATVIQESPFSDIVGPKVFPYMIGVLLGVSSLYILARPDAAPHWPPASRLFEIGMAIAVMVAYAIILPTLGFLLSTTLASAYLTWRLGTAPLQAAIAGVLTSIGIYIGFKLILGLSLASGVLGL